MNLDSELTREEFDVLAKIALRFLRRVGKGRLQQETVEALLSEMEYDAARSAMAKIADEGERDGVYWRAANSRDLKLSDWSRNGPKKSPGAAS